MLLISDSSPSGIRQSLFSSTEAALPKPLPKYYQLGTKFKCIKPLQTSIKKTVRQWRKYRKTWKIQIPPTPMQRKNYYYRHNHTNKSNTQINKIPVKILISLFTGENTILKFFKKHTKTQVAKIILNRKGGITLTFPKTHNVEQNHHDTSVNTRMQVNGIE